MAMAASTLNSKSRSHARSISLPSRPHPQLDEHLCRLRAFESAPTSSSSSTIISNKLSGVKDLHDCVEDLLLLPKQGLPKELVDELLDGSLRLLDVCAIAKDVLANTKEFTHQLQSVLRRRWSTEFGLAKEIGEYLAYRKLAKKAAHKALKNLKGGKENKLCTLSVISSNNEAMSMANMLREIEAVSFTVLECILVFIASPSKTNKWSLVSKLMQNKRVAICEEEESNNNEFDKVDVVLQTLISQKKNKSDNTVQPENLLNGLEEMEMCIQDLEEGLECLFRRLIKTRVSLLNTLNH